MDAESVLIALGFGPSEKQQKLQRIPDRFLAPSKVIQIILFALPKSNAYFQSSKVSLDQLANVMYMHTSSSLCPCHTSCWVGTCFLLFTH